MGIPDLETLSGLMTAFVVPFSQILGPSVIILLAAKHGLSGHPLTGKEKAAIGFGFVVGVAMLAAGISSTIFNLLSISFVGGMFVQWKAFQFHPQQLVACHVLKQGYCWKRRVCSVRPPSIVHVSTVKVARVADLIGPSVIAQERNFVLVPACSGEFRQRSRA